MVPHIYSHHSDNLLATLTYLSISSKLKAPAGERSTKDHTRLQNMSLKVAPNHQVRFTPTPRLFMSLHPTPLVTGLRYLLQPNPVSVFQMLSPRSFGSAPPFPLRVAVGPCPPLMKSQSANPLRDENGYGLHHHSPKSSSTQNLPSLARRLLLLRRTIPTDNQSRKSQFSGRCLYEELMFAAARLVAGHDHLG